MLHALLLLSLVSPLSPQAQDPPAKASVVDGVALIPTGSIHSADERPLPLLQHAFLNEVLDFESRAIEHEAALIELQAEVDAARRERVAQDRILVRQMVENPAVGDAMECTAVGANSGASLPAIDRFLRGFMLERLRSREFFPIEDLQRWRAENEKFLAGGDFGSRDRAVMWRARSFKSMLDAFALRALLRSLEGGPLTNEQRDGALSTLQTMFPDAALPSGGAAVGGAPPSTGFPGAAPEPGPDSLPRLDGVEIPTIVLPDLNDPTAADRAAASALVSQFIEQKQLQAKYGPKAKRASYRPQPPPRRGPPRRRG